MEKKRQQALVQAAYVDELKAGRLPESFKPIALQLLFKPDKNSIEYKALDSACRELQTTPQRLMLTTGGIASPKDLHYARFLFEYFPKGSGFPPVQIPAVRDLPLADVQAFPSMMSPPRKSMMPCRSSSWLTATGASGFILQRRDWVSGARMRSTKSRAIACRRSTCRAKRSPCCRMNW